MDAPHYTAKCQAELHNAVSMLGGDAASPRLAGMAELIIQVDDWALAFFSHARAYF